MLSLLNPSDTERNLLFGVLALQGKFISPDQFIAGMHAWILDKKKSLGQVLLERGELTLEQLQALDGLTLQHIQAHGDDAESSLVDLSKMATVDGTVWAIGDPDVQSTWSKIRASTDKPRGNGSLGNGVRYRRRALHKEGGLGDVFYAEDIELHREVALKEIKPRHADIPESRARFVMEAEITGRLEHPGIVAVYGLGIYEDGRPHYAMRFIRGNSLKEAIDRFYAVDKPGRSESERSLAFRQLLRRFVDVCNAVAYAHSRGVLHRDLKPANIMLGKYGETLVVDWGLAKTGLEPKPSADEATVDSMLHPASGSDSYQTQAGAAMGTVPYMSPEQASGRVNDLGPASDIYSLGSTLYMMITGRRAYEGKDDGGLLTKVQRGEFAPPCRVKPDTAPALEAICLKAMALKPEDRYATALDLAADVDHWLADEPVSVYPEPLTAQLGRWGRRHRALLVGAAAVLVSAVVALSLSTALIWNEQQKTAEQKRFAENNLILLQGEQKKTSEQKQQAEENYTLASTIGFNSIDLIEATQIEFAANPMLHDKRKAALMQAASACRQFLKHDPDDTDLQTRAARVFRYAANFHRLENDFAAAEPLYRDSVQLQEKLVQQFDDAKHRDDLSGTLRDQAYVQVMRGDLAKAATNYGRAIEIAAQLHMDHPEEASCRRSSAAAQLELASVELSLGHLAQAQTLAQSAAAEFGKLVEIPKNSKHAYDSLLRAAALTQVAILQRDEDIEKALATHRIAIDIMSEQTKSKPGNIVPADMLHHRAACQLEQAISMARVPKRRANAEKNLASCALQWKGLGDNYKKVPLYRASQAKACILLGALRADDKRLDEAEAEFKTGVGLLEQLIKDFGGVPSYYSELGRARFSLAQLTKDAEARAELLSQADAALSRAIELSPDNVRDIRTLKELRDNR